MVLGSMAIITRGKKQLLALNISSHAQVSWTRPQTIILNLDVDYQLHPSVLWVP
jgi:hypothetical protein